MAPPCRMHNNERRKLYDPTFYRKMIVYVNRNSLCALRISRNSYQIEEEYFKCM